MLPSLPGSNSQVPALAGPSFEKVSRGVPRANASTPSLLGRAPIGLPSPRGGWDGAASPQLPSPRMSPSASLGVSGMSGALIQVGGGGGGEERDSFVPGYPSAGPLSGITERPSIAMTTLVREGGERETPPAALSVLQQPSNEGGFSLSSCWHEVTAYATRDPATGA